MTHLHFAYQGLACPLVVLTQRKWAERDAEGPCLASLCPWCKTMILL